MLLTSRQIYDKEPAKSNISLNEIVIDTNFKNYQRVRNDPDWQAEYCDALISSSYLGQAKLVGHAWKRNGYTFKLRLIS